MSRFGTFVGQHRLGSFVISCGSAPFGGIWVQRFAKCSEPDHVSHGSGGPFLKWGEPLFSERNGFERPILRIGRLRLFWLKPQECR